MGLYQRTIGISVWRRRSVPVRRQRGRVVVPKQPGQLGAVWAEGVDGRDGLLMKLAIDPVQLVKVDLFARLHEEHRPSALFHHVAAVRERACHRVEGREVLPGRVLLGPRGHVVGHLDVRGAPVGVHDRDDAPLFQRLLERKHADGRLSHGAQDHLRPVSVARHHSARRVINLRRVLHPACRGRLLERRRGLLHRLLHHHLDALARRLGVGLRRLGAGLERLDRLLQRGHLRLMRCAQLGELFECLCDRGVRAELVDRRNKEGGEVRAAVQPLHFSEQVAYPEGLHAKGHAEQRAKDHVLRSGWRDVLGEAERRRFGRVLVVRVLLPRPVVVGREQGQVCFDRVHGGQPDWLPGGRLARIDEFLFARQRKRCGEKAAVKGREAIDEARHRAIRLESQPLARDGVESVSGDDLVQRGQLRVDREDVQPELLVRMALGRAQPPRRVGVPVWLRLALHVHRFDAIIDHLAVHALLIEQQPVEDLRVVEFSAMRREL